MKKNFLMSIVVAALVVFGVKTYYDKKTTNNDQVSVEKIKDLLGIEKLYKER